MAERQTLTDITFSEYTVLESGIPGAFHCLRFNASQASKTGIKKEKNLKDRGDCMNIQNNSFNANNHGLSSAGIGFQAGCFFEYTACMQIIYRGKCCSDSYLTRDARNITVFVKNTGNNPIKVCLQNSPNGYDFIEDPQLLMLEPNQLGYLTPYIFSKYTRVAVKSECPSSAFIWFQIQNYFCGQPC